MTMDDIISYLLYTFTLPYMFYALTSHTCTCMSISSLHNFYFIPFIAHFITFISHRFLIVSFSFASLHSFVFPCVVTFLCHREYMRYTVAFRTMLLRRVTVSEQTCLAVNIIVGSLSGRFEI